MRWKYTKTLSSLYVPADKTPRHPYLQRVQEELHARFIDVLYPKYYVMYPVDSKGAIRIDMVRLEVEATKP